MTVSADDDSPLARAYNAALAHEKAGRLDAAAAAYREVLALDPEDHGGAAVRLAAMGLGATPKGAPQAYVATLFDQQAEAFEEILVDRLGYDVPALVADAVAPFGPFRRTLDLGCGTGLAGEALRGATVYLAGVDLSEGMLGIADDKGVYDDLYLGDVTEFLLAEDEAAGAEDGEDDAPGGETRAPGDDAAAPEADAVAPRRADPADPEAPPGFDLIVATDVLPYLGPVETFFAAVAANTMPGGVFAFSTETLSDAEFGAAAFRVGPGHRFAHRRDYLAESLAAAGFEMLSAAPITVRFECGVPVPGDLVVARRHPG